MVCLYLVCVLLAPLYYRYKSHPTVTSLEMDYFNWNVSYPAITLCPEYKTDDAAFAKVVELYKNKTGEDLSGYLWSISNMNLYTIESLDLQTPETIPMIPSEDYVSIAADTFMKFDLNHVNTNTDWGISMATVMTEYGMCHVINSNVAVYDDPTKWYTPEGTAKYKKTNIELSIYNGEFYTQVLDYAGIYKIFIHSPDESISSNTASYLHVAQSFLFIGVMASSHRITQQLKSASINYRNCRLIEEPMTKRYPVYSYNSCLTECKIRMINKLCGCVPHWYKPLEDEIICTLQDLPCVIRYRPSLLSLSLDNDVIEQFADPKDLPSTSKDCGCANNCEVRSGGVINLCLGSSLISIMELIMIAIRPIVHITIQAIRNKYNLI